jgi:hypothetical protein
MRFEVCNRFNIGGYVENPASVMLDLFPSRNSQ